MTQESPDLSWSTLTGWPGTVHLHDFDPIRHPLTPAAVRERYARTCSVTALVVWCDRQQGLVGFKGGATEHTWRVDELRGIRLDYRTPLKGSGGIWLEAVTSDGTELMAMTHSFQESDLDWFRRFARMLANPVKLAVEETSAFDC